MKPGFRVYPLLIAATVAALAVALTHRARPRAPTDATRGPSRLAPGPTKGAAPPSEEHMPPPGGLRFVDVAAEAGLTVPHFEGADGQHRLVETMGSGVGLIDYDGDGWLDVYLAQGCPLPIDPAQRRWTSRLYRNRRDGTFEDVTESAGVGFNGYGQGVAVGDYDGDGRDDLFVSGFGGNALYRNNGDGTFTDATQKAGVAGSGWASSCAFADLDGDGDLDLYVVHYLARTVDEQGRPTVNCNATPGRLGYCPPTAFAPEPDVLYRNDGDGKFTDASRESGIAAKAGNGLGLAILDLDDDGRPEIFVANDQSPNQLWHNRGGLNFEETALSWGLAYNESGELRAGMGVAAGDYDGDGRVDLFVTNFYEEAGTLYRNAAPGQFQVTTASARLKAPTRSKLGFGTGFFDADRDGRLDLFATNGHVNDVRPLNMPYAMEPQLFRNLGSGRFADVSASVGPYFREPWLGRGAAFGDLDNDGDTDIVVTHLDRPPALLRNDTETTGHFLMLRLIGGKQGGPVGARVVARVGQDTLTRVVAGGTSYLSASDRRVFLGLGDAERVDRLEVRWPSGLVQEWRDPPADRFLELTPGEAPRPYAMEPPAPR